MSLKSGPSQYLYMNIQPKKKKKTLYMNFGESEKDKDWVQETDLHVPPYHVIYYCQRCVSEKIIYGVTIICLKSCPKLGDESKIRPVMGGIPAPHHGSSWP